MHDSFVHRKTAIALAWTLLCVGVHSSTLAQDVQPPGAAADAAAVPVPRDPLVLAILETNPETPRELVQAISTLIDLKKAIFALPFVQQLNAQQLDDEALAGLLTRFGTATFLKIAQAKELDPDGGALAERVIAAAHRRATDPEVLARLIDQLQDRVQSKRLSAIRQLRQGREAAVVALVAVAADPRKAAQIPGVRTALVAMEEDAVDAMVTLIYSGEPSLAALAADVLGQIGDPRAARHLFAPALVGDDRSPLTTAAVRAVQSVFNTIPSPPEAVGLLVESAQRQRRLADIQNVTTPETILVWRWNPDQDQLTFQPEARRLAMAQRSARFASDAMAIMPHGRAARRAYLIGHLESAALQAAAVAGAADKPATDAASTAHDLDEPEGAPFTIAELLELLYPTDEEVGPLAAAGAARLIGLRAGPELLQTPGHRPNPLVQALRHPSRMVRFAALEAVLRLDQGAPYAGSSYVPECLMYFIGVRGAPLALVADPRAFEARRIAGLLVENGYESEIATTGRELFQLATRSPECEMLLLHVMLQEPTIEALLAEIRHDARTADLPVGLVAEADLLPRAEHLARLDPLCQVVVRPHNAETLQYQSERLLEARTAGQESHQRRMAEAADCLNWAMKLAGRQRSVYDLSGLEPAIQQAMEVPELTVLASRALAMQGSPRAQSNLVDLASRVLMPLKMRQAARDAFCQSVDRFGILLTTQQILRQYDRYNLSEQLDKATQELFGSILDCLEAQVAERAPAAPADEPAEVAPRQ